MSVTKKDENFQFIIKNDKLILYNNLTGLYYFINDNVKSYIENHTSQNEPRTELSEFLSKMHFWGDINDFYSKLYPKVSPYAIWNNELVIYPSNKHYDILYLDKLEINLLNLCTGLNNINSISTSLNIQQDKLFKILNKFIKLKVQIIKLFNDPYKNDNRHFFNVFETNKTDHKKSKIIDLEKYYRELKPENTFNQFEDIETTVSFLFRNENDLLENMKYGQKFIKSVLSHFSITLENKRILEVGGGLGDFAFAILEYVQSNGYLNTVEYVISDLSPALLDKQKKKCLKYHLNMNFINSRGENLIFDNDTFDLVLSNEVIADFLSIKKDTHEYDINSNDSLIKGGIRVINDYDLSKVDDDYINVGSIMFLEEIYRILKKGGIAVISEYTEKSNYATISNNMSDHREVSINFNILINAAEKIGFKCEYINLQDFLGININSEILSPHSYYALKKIIKLEKQIYSKDFICDLNKKCNFSNLYFINVSNILKFFKVLLLKKE